MALPLYSLPACAPSYSSIPQNDEETIEYNPRHGRSTNSSTFIRRWHQVDLILKGQEEEARLPCYGRGGVIDGELGISSPEKIFEVTVKVRISSVYRIAFRKQDNESYSV